MIYADSPECRVDVPVSVPVHMNVFATICESCITGEI